jgi:branched-chain amino acid transport system permease protein
MLAAFGLLFIIDNIAVLIWGSQYHGLGNFLIQPIFIGGVPFATNSIIALCASVGIGVIFYAFLSLTRTGKAIRASAQDPETAGLMGVNINVVLALCFGLGALLAGLAGVLVATSNPSLTTSIGLQYTVNAIIVVVLGGLGSIPGSFIGGILLGLVGSIVTKYQADLVLAAFYFIFMAMLIIRPKGLLGK